MPPPTAAAAASPSSWAWAAEPAPRSCRACRPAIACCCRDSAVPGSAPMREAIRQSLENLRANTLRSVLTMFGILWGIVSIVVLSAMGEGFRRGNDAVLREFGRNIGIVWGGRTSMQAGGERAGRVIRLTVDDARAVERQARLVSTLSPEINRGGVQVKSRYNAAAVGVHGIEPPYQAIRTIELQYGRLLNWEDERETRRVALIGWEMSQQLFGARHPIGEAITIAGTGFTI